MDLFLQIWGAGAYLLNKILFALSEDKTEQLKRKMKIIGWMVYIIGVPAWVIILASKNNWIAAFMEAGGLPAMFLGLYNTIHHNKKNNIWFNRIVTACTFSAIVFGLVFSLNHYGGLSSFSQYLEMGVMVGFLLGSYLLAKNNANGWLWFMVMNISTAWLMFTQEKNILGAQQLISLGFVIYGYTQSKQHKHLDTLK